MTINLNDPDVIGIVGVEYRLRAGAPMPIAGTDTAVTFHLHTFMAEKKETVTYTYTERLLESADFRGQGGDLISANFSRLPAKGGNVFSGKQIKTPEYVEEDELTTATDFNVGSPVTI